MKTSSTYSTLTSAYVGDKLMELANCQADLVDSFPRHYRAVPQAVKRRVANQFDEYIEQLDPLVAKLESIVQKHRLHNLKSMNLLQGAIHQADRNVSAAAEETASQPELNALTEEFRKLRQSYRETLKVLDTWIHELEDAKTPVSMAA